MPRPVRLVPRAHRWRPNSYRRRSGGVPHRSAATPSVRPCGPLPRTRANDHHSPTRAPRGVRLQPDVLSVAGLHSLPFDSRVTAIRASLSLVTRTMTVRRIRGKWYIFARFEKIAHAFA